MTGMTLAYLVFDVRQPKRWRAFLTGMLGCQPGDTLQDGSEAFRIDGAAYRLLLRQGPADDLAVLGWTADDATLQGIRDKLGDQAEAFSAQECAVRQVQAGIRFRDPMGLVNEVVTGLPQTAGAFTSDIMPGGFETGALGLGHAVLGVGRHAAAMERFYIDVLGLCVTERIDTKIGPIKVDGVFLHCNRRHHSLALIAIPSRKRMLHFMLQAKAMRDVGQALERARAAGVAISLSLGQHPDPDGTVSFYAQTPSGFDYEIGAGTREIDPATHQPETKYRTSDWGHKPSLRMQLRGAMDLLADKFGKKAA